MKPGDLEEKYVSGEEVYRGEILSLQCDVVRLPNGAQALREYIRHPGAVAILALFDDGRVLLERQFRYPHHRDFIELPAGKRDPGEAPLETAQRELLEETGYVAAEWQRLGEIQNAIAYSDEVIEIFLARGLEKREAKLDPEEFLEVLTLPLAEALAMVRDGRITDAKSVVALLWAKAFLG